MLKDELRSIWEQVSPVHGPHSLFLQWRAMKAVLQNVLRPRLQRTALCFVFNLLQPSRCFISERGLRWPLLYCQSSWEGPGWWKNLNTQTLLYDQAMSSQPLWRVSEPSATVNASPQLNFEPAFGASNDAWWNSIQQIDLPATERQLWAVPPTPHLWPPAIIHQQTLQ